MSTRFIENLDGINGETGNLAQEATRDMIYDIHPAAAFVVPVDGGFIVCDTYRDYDAWKLTRV